jgi:anaerobic magnesium-protoporphyrin IX monomethyl ester cyclase
MMLSILVCHSYFLRLDQKQWERAKPYPPLATLQVAAMLRALGHSVSFFDSMLADAVGDFGHVLDASRPQLVLFYEDTFNFLSKMCLGTMRQAACDMIGAAHRTGTRVIAAGPDVSDSPSPYLHAGADIALMGEGLAALLHILPGLEPGIDAPTLSLIQGVSGVACLVDGRAVTVSGAKTLPTSTSASCAAWDLVDMDRYRDVWMKAHGYFSLNMAASRGCSFRCAWCAKPTWGNQYLQRPAGEVAQELSFLKRSFRPDHIWFADDIFGFRVDWVGEFAAAVRTLDAGIPFTIQTRADLVTERMAGTLRDAGCREAWLGAESGSQKILDSMNKGTTVQEIVTARRRLNECGIRVGFFIQLGYLDEQIEDIEATRELLHVARPDEIGVSVSYPLPGTRFYELVKAQLGLKTRWKESNDLEMMFHGTYTSDFYRSIRNLLHEQVDLQNTGAADDVVGGAQGALSRRWRDLLMQEHRYRSPGGATAVASC